MKNTERQASLDKQKWLDSEIVGEDLSGAMCYCDCCPHEIDDYCTITHEKRVETCACAKAYNRMVRRRKSWEA